MASVTYPNGSWHGSYKSQDSQHMLEVSNAVARAQALFTVVHDAQNSATWFPTWKAKCEDATGVVVIFSAAYRKNFTQALQMEAGVVLRLYRRKQIKLFILDPEVHNAANVRANILDNASGMGDIDAWVAFTVANGVGAEAEEEGAAHGGSGGGGSRVVSVHLTAWLPAMKDCLTRQMDDGRIKTACCSRDCMQ